LPIALALFLGGLLGLARLTFLAETALSLAAVSD
jgi:hypothetical protein